jgi:predicted metal-dependent hydrolase
MAGIIARRPPADVACAAVSAPPAYRVRRSTRARRVSVRVDAHAGVEVVLPARASAREADAAMDELRPWIERRLAAVAAARARVAPHPGYVPYLGARLALRPQDGRTRVARRGGELLVPGAATEQALERWYRRMARAEIAARLEEVTARLGRRHSALSIRGQRTRWGSCSAAGALSFNWRLLLAPEAVLEYVIWHEACHLLVMDHSRRFWALLERHLPGYREPRRWLRANGGALTLAGGRP